MEKKLEFQGFPKMARLSREIIITEKIDGTNAQILITGDGDLMAGSRTKWITTENDNHGFAKWVEGNRDELLKLGNMLKRFKNSYLKLSLFNFPETKNEQTQENCLGNGL